MTLILLYRRSWRRNGSWAGWSCHTWFWSLIYVLLAFQCSLYAPSNLVWIVFPLEPRCFHCLNFLILKFSWELTIGNKQKEIIRRSAKKEEEDASLYSCSIDWMLWSDISSLNISCSTDSHSPVITYQTVSAEAASFLVLSLQVTWAEMMMTWCRESCQNLLTTSNILLLRSLRLSWICLLPLLIYLSLQHLL